MLSTNNVRPLMTINMPVFYNSTETEQDQIQDDLPQDEEITHIVKICLKVKLDEVLNIPIDDIEALKIYKPDFE